MCGILAIVNRRDPVPPELVARLRDELIHRGPDDAGAWISDDRRVGFGHRRLSIIDLLHGHQPMASGSGLTTVVYNGEVYNHAELRLELEHAGVVFSTRCDTEVVVEAYERWGEACLDRFDGMFAFAIWDSVRRRLFFARDRLGKKPLYYAPSRDGLVLASEIKAVVAHPDIRRDVDRAALAHYLSFLVTPAPSTLFAGVSKLPAGHCGTWDEASGVRIRRWWSPPLRERLEVHEDEAAERVLELLTRAVEKRMMSDVPFGVYLSGGVDSSANVALMSRLTDEPVRTFSVAFEGEPSLDELRYARDVAQAYRTRHVEIAISDDMVIGSLPDLIHHQDEPLADPVCVPLLHLARATKEHGVTVVQIGEGSDEIFRGYQGYSNVLERTRRLRLASRLIPRPILAAGLRLGAPLLSPLAQEFALEAVLRGVPPAHGIAGFAERTKRRLLVDSEGFPTAHDYLHRLVGSGSDEEEILNVTLDHELRLRLAELLLMRVDKMTMAASVEGRAPFLDRELVEFAVQLPTRLHWRDGAKKLLLKRALRDVLPSRVLDRPKQGFGAPVWRWLESLGDLAAHELLREPIMEYFDERVLRELLAASPSTRSGFELWTVLNFALWHRHFIEGEDLRVSSWMERANAA